MPASTDADIDAVIDQAWQNLYARHPSLSDRVQTSVASPDAYALALLRGAGAELRQASQALATVAQTLKIRPNMTVPQRLQLAAFAMQASTRAQQASQGLV